MKERRSAVFTCGEPAVFKMKTLQWLSQYHECAFFETACPGEKIKSGKAYDWIAATVAVSFISQQGNSLDKLGQAIKKTKDWWFGYLGYDIKNEIEKLESANPDPIGFPGMYFFNPAFVIFCSGNRITVSIQEEYHGASDTDPEKIYHHILGFPVAGLELQEQLCFTSRSSKVSYLEHVEKIMQHIRHGDIYELNLCMEFFSRPETLVPLSVFVAMQDKVPAPHAFYFRIGHRYIMSASPERFLRKNADRLYSMPMKGTIKRGDNPEADEKLKEKLLSSEKEKTENVMITDLVRNDLSRVAERGSVKVEQLNALYTYPKVHQLVSTVSCRIPVQTTFPEILRATFPMGSMTGAPKIKAMQLIDRFEGICRGVYSGSAGFIEPDGDFDFNVIIRTLLYDEEKKYLSIMAGSAITANSDPGQEYEECLLKAGYVISAAGGYIKS